jgi:benzoate membrane transport protein
MLALRNDGSLTRSNPIVTGIGSLIMAPFRIYLFNIAAITAVIATE